MKIVVVGGVALGASFATRMRRLSEEHEITIYEKTGFISYANCGLPYNLSGKIARDKLELADAKKMKTDFDIDVQVNSEVTSIDTKKKTITVKDTKTGKVKTVSYDKLILGPGTSALILPIPGMDKEEAVFTLKNLDDLDKVTEYIEKHSPKDAVVFGAGFIGLEVAESLIEAGWNVSVIDIASTVVKLDKDVSTIVENELTDNGVNLYMEAFTDKIDTKTKNVVLKDGRKIKYDIIFATAGIKPNTDFIKDAGIKVDNRGIVMTDEHMQTSDKDVYAGGDIVYTTHEITEKRVYSPLAWGANRQARVIANHIAGIDDKQPKTLNTAIIKIFRKPVAQTGLNEFGAKMEGYTFGTSFIEANDHAGYYPGALKVVLKLVYDKKTLRVLGAQSVGVSSDKKIDVIATVIKSKGTIYDLADLNLTYSPPFGSAKDVLNVSAFVAINAIERNIPCVGVTDVPKGALHVDVRPETIFEMSNVKGSINIDKTDLRTTDKLPKDKSTPIYLLCNTGHESYNAWGIVVGLGYKNVFNIKGGFHLHSAIEKAANYEAGTSVNRKAKKVENKTVNASTVAPKAMAKGESFDVDCSGLACPGPILKVSEKLKEIKDGDIVNVKASDFGFEEDIKVWSKKNGHTILSVDSSDTEVNAVIQKGSNVNKDTAAMASALLQGRKKATIVLFSGEYDKMLAAMIISQAAASLGTEVTIFATFWGLNALRVKPAKRIKKKFMERMFGRMMPRGAAKLPLSRMNMGGMGQKMIKSIMKKHNVTSPEVMLQQTIDMGVSIIACTMSMDLLGIDKKELVTGIKYAGAAAYVSESDDSNLTLFI